MKTRRPFPEQGALVRARAALLEAGVALPFRSWNDLAALCDTPWLPALARSSPSAARVLRRRLLPLSSPPLSVAAAAARPRGELVHVAGRARAAGASTELGFASPLWRVDREPATGALVEEAEDFLLTDRQGARVLVIVDGGHLVGGDRLLAGDEVSVYGCFDEVPDRLGLWRSPHGRGGVAPALCSGWQWPLLVTRLAASPPAGEPQGVAPVVR